MLISNYVMHMRPLHDINQSPAQMDIKIYEKRNTKQNGLALVRSIIFITPKQEMLFRKTWFRNMFSSEHMRNKFAGLPSAVVVSVQETKQPINNPLQVTWLTTFSTIFCLPSVAFPRQLNSRGKTD